MRPKRGIAAWQYTCDQLNVLTNLTWLYDWTVSWQYVDKGNQKIDPSKCTYPKEFVSMVWGPHFNPDNMTFAKGVNYILGFNEPDWPPLNLKPKDAAEIWPSIEKMAKEIGALVISPAPADDAKWLDEFFSLCNGCLDRMHAVAIHTYVRSLNDLKTKIGWFRKFKKPIWITEMAGGLHNRTMDDQLRFMRDAIPYLDNDPQIERYAWFSLEPSNQSDESFTALVNKARDSKLNELGLLYQSL